MNNDIQLYLGFLKLLCSSLSKFYLKESEWPSVMGFFSEVDDKELFCMMMLSLKLFIA